MSVHDDILSVLAIAFDGHKLREALDLPLVKIDSLTRWVVAVNSGLSRLRSRLRDAGLNAVSSPYASTVIPLQTPSSVSFL